MPVGRGRGYHARMSQTFIQTFILLILVTDPFGLMGLILSAMAVEMFLAGVREFIKSM